MNKTRYEHIYEHNGWYYVRLYRKEKGKPLFKALRTRRISTARRRAQDEIRKFLGEKPKKPKRSLVSDEWGEFLELKRAKAPATFRSMEVQGRRHLLPYFGEMLIDEITEADWEKYVAHCHKTNAKRKLFNDRKYFAMLLNYSFRKGVVPRKLTLRNPDPETKAGRVYSDDEITALLNASGPRLHLQIQLAFTMGMRRGEILGLEWDRVDFERRTIHLRAQDTKIRKARTFGISEICLDLLRRRKRRSPGRCVFWSPGEPDRPQAENRSAFSAAKTKAGIKGRARFHDLRHTFLTRAFKTATNPALICHYAGLSLEVATRTYLHFDVEDTRVVSGLVKNLCKQVSQENTEGKTNNESKA